MLKEIWGKFAYYTFLGLLIIFGLFFGKLRVNAESIGIYAPMNGYNGVSGCSSNGSYNYDTLGPNVNGNIYWNIGSVGSAISGKAKNIYIAFKRDLDATKTYDVTITFHGTDVTNKLKSSMIYIYNGDACGDMSGESISLVSFKNSATSSSNTNKLKLRIYAPVLISNWGVVLRGGNTDITSVNNFGIDSVNLVVVDTSGTGDIINNQNQNATDIINSQIDNTQTIINNQNTNTQQQIDSQKVCKQIDKNNIVVNGALSSDAVINANDTRGVTGYLNIQKATIKLLTRTQTFLGYYCFYNTNKELIECRASASTTIGEIIPPSNAIYMRATILKSENKPTYEICQDGNQSLSNSVSDLNNSINNDDVDNPNDFIDDMQDMLPTNGTITQLIALPITLYQKILTNLNGTCTAMNLGNLYGTNLIMPCIEVSNYLGNTLWNTIDIIISGVFVLTIARKMIKAFNNFTSMKEGDVIND